MKHAKNFGKTGAGNMGINAKKSDSFAFKVFRTYINIKFALNFHFIFNSLTRFV
jgi:hypothetical protein